MARLRKDDTEQARELAAAMVSQDPQTNIDDMPLETLGDYMRYNAKAREMNKKLRICRYPIKQCPIELHPTERVVLGRNDQPTNPLPVYLSNDMIEYKNKLVPGKPYDLPKCVVDYLASKGEPIWKWVTQPDGSKETRIAHYKPRFSLRTIARD